MRPMTFGSWVRERRKELQLTQKKLARLVGCAPVTIQKIEEVQRRPSAQVAKSLAQHLEIEALHLAAFLGLARADLAAPRTPAPRAAPPLPVPPTQLLGRERELLLLWERLTQPALRLLTLTGPPGVGKSRLALQLAHEWREHSSIEVHFVELAPLGAADQVLPALARRLGLVPPAVGPVLPRLERWLMGRQALLVLDNFEHLLPAADDLSALLEHCAGLRVLVTSRQALRLYGEQEWLVEPLPLPTANLDSRSALLQNPAISLFLERVQAVNPDFVFDTHSMGAVLEVVTNLEGLPLALELAAGRLRHLSLDALRTRLQEQRLSTLSAGPRDWPQRHQTLDGAIAWSFERLAPRQQGIFARLGMFVGGFDAPAAAAVCAADHDDLAVLLDANLIRRNEERYSLLESLRVYALERLAASELEAVRAAHLKYFQMQLQQRSKEDARFIHTEIGNVRSAVQFTLESAQPQVAAELLLPSSLFWELHGYQREGLSWIQAALAMPGVIHWELRVRLLNRAAVMAWQTGHFDLAADWLTEALDLSRQAKNLGWEASVLMHVGRVELERGCYAAAIQVLRLALTISRSVGTNDLIASTLYQLAQVSFIVGDLEYSHACTDEGLALCNAQSDYFWEPLLLDVRGQLAMVRGDYATAQADLLRALGLISHLRFNSNLLISVSERLLFPPNATLEQILSAVRLLGAVDATREACGLPFSVPHQARMTRNLELARSRTDDLDWTLSWSAGRDMTLREAIAYAQSLPAIIPVNLR